MQSTRDPQGSPEAPSDARTRIGYAGAQLRLFELDGGMPRWVCLALGAWRLVVTGNHAICWWTDMGVAAVAERYRSNERTAALVTGDARRLFRYLQAMGARDLSDVTRELVLAWCWAARTDRMGRLREVEAATARRRQWVASVCFEELAKLGAPVDPAAVIGSRIPRPASAASTRPLTGEEADLVRKHSHFGFITSRLPLILAAGFCGGTAAETALLRLCDIDLYAATVTFGGDAARTNPLDSWSAETIARWLHNQSDKPEPGSRLCVSEDIDVVRGARSVSIRLGDLLRDAGLSHQPGVSARSVRLTGARQVLEQHGIAAAARFLGAVSLDTTAAAIQYRWQDGDA